MKFLDKNYAKSFHFLREKSIVSLVKIKRETQSNTGLSLAIFFIVRDRVYQSFTLLQWLKLAYVKNDEY